VPLLELVVVATAQLKLLSGDIPNDVEDIGSGRGDGEDRLDVVDIDASVQVERGLGADTAGLLLLLGDLLTAEEDLFKEINLELLVGCTAGVQEFVVQEKAAKVGDKFPVLPRNLVLECLGDQVVVLLAVGLVDAISNALDGALAID